MSTQQPDERRPAADDVAHDMDERLHDLDERLHQVERNLEKPVEQPFQRLGGDQASRRPDAPEDA